MVCDKINDKKKKVNYLHQSLVYILNSDEKEKMALCKNDKYTWMNYIKT